MLGLKMRKALCTLIRCATSDQNSTSWPAKRSAFSATRERKSSRSIQRNTSAEDAKLAELWKHLNLFVDLCAHRSPLVIPNRDGSDQWLAFHQFLDDIVQQQQRPNQNDPDAKAFINYANLLVSYDKGEKSEFNKLVTQRLNELDKTNPDLMRRMDLEVFFNEFAPFFHCMLLYVLIAIYRGPFLAR